MAVINDPVVVRTPAAQREFASEPRLLLRVPSADRVLELVAVFTIITSLIGLGCALAGVFHAPQVLLASLLLSGWYAHCTRDNGPLHGTAPRWRHLLLLITVALLFRLPVYHYTLGAQDEGLYTNMAHHIVRTGGIADHDKVMDSLQGTPYLQRYLNDNRIYEGNSPTLYLLGVYARQPGTDHLVFQFYYLFPVWMALVGGILGSNLAEYALTFFALLSIVVFYRLALLLTRSYTAGLVAGLLLALNPLHAFFSKFPVTEMPTLALSLIGFVFLAAYWSADVHARKQRWLWISSLALLCLFVTRISGFMYMPFVVALALASLVWDNDPQRRRAMQWWAVGISLVYLASVLYGLHWSRYYSRDTYLTSFEPLFGHHWKWAIEALVLLGFGLWVVVAIWARKSTLRSRCEAAVRPVGLLIGCVVLVALAFGLLKIYWLGWTDHYSASGLGVLGLAHAGWRGVSASSLSTLLVYLGPLLVFAFLALVPFFQNDARVAFLRLFVAGFFVFAVLLQWVLPYAPYYARYLLSELVPYLILFVVCVWSAMRISTARALVSAVLALSIIYAGAISAAQIGKSEDDGAYESLARLVAPVEANDLILLDTLHRSPNTSIIKTPLVYTFGRNVVTVDDQSLADTGYIAELNSIYDDLFLISSDPAPPLGFTKLDGVRFRVMTYEHTHFFPRKLVPAQDIVLNLYRLDRPQLPLNSKLLFVPGRPWLEWLRSGWHDPESWGVWSRGEKAQLDIDPRELPDKNLSLQLDAHVFITPAHPLQRVNVSVDGRLVAQYRVVYPATTLSMHIPINRAQIESGRRIPIDFALPDAISPEAVGAGTDNRIIALGLVSLRVSVASSISSRANSN